MRKNNLDRLAAKRKTLLKYTKKTKKFPKTASLTVVKEFRHIKFFRLVKNNEHLDLTNHNRDLHALI